MIETPRYDLTLFKVHFELLTLKGFTKGEHVLRFEAVVHNTKALGVGRVLERLPDIVARLWAMIDRFTTMLDCVDVGFVSDNILEELPCPSFLGATRVGDIDLNKARMRAVLAALSALAIAPEGFTVSELSAKVQAMTSQNEYSIRQASYDLRKLRAKELVLKPGRTRRYQVPPRPPGPSPPSASCAIKWSALSSPGCVAHAKAKPASWTPVDRDYETLRIDVQTIFCDLGITTGTLPVAA